MATLTIRNLNDDTKAKLRQLAASRGHSMEEEVRRILNRAVGQRERKGLGSRISQQFAEIGGVDLEIPARSNSHRAPLFSDDPS
jgi:plasmid stability protein